MSKSKPVTTTDDHLEAVSAAVTAGRALIEQRKTKIEAAMAIYAALEALPQVVVVKAFIDGATLTEKGALTYWYNCRRKLKKQRLLEQAAGAPT